MNYRELDLYLRRYFGEVFRLRKLKNVPQLRNIAVHSSISKALENNNLIVQGLFALWHITGTRPERVRAKHSVASFKLREGDVFGVKVMLHNKEMYLFFERLIELFEEGRINKLEYKITPNLYLKPKNRTQKFDGLGNYNFGIGKIITFSEIDSVRSRVKDLRGLHVAINTTGKNNLYGLFCLFAIDFPLLQEAVVSCNQKEKFVPPLGNNVRSKDLKSPILARPSMKMYRRLRKIAQDELALQAEEKVFLSETSKVQFSGVEHSNNVLALVNTGEEIVLQGHRRAKN